MKKKKLIIFMLVLIIMMLGISNVYAIDPDTYKPNEISNGGKLATMGNKIIGGIQYMGSITSVAVLVVIGIKYIIGSTEERAEYKETMFPYVIGALMVFAITRVLSIIENIFS